MTEKMNHLKITIISFSYRTGIPRDLNGNGGGFVFDCRALHNPGRYTEYRKLTGKDQPVVDFLIANSKADEFVKNVLQIVQMSTNSYLELGYTNLQLCFGCTGGQHRSVYCAEQITQILKSIPYVETELIHTELSGEEDILKPKALFKPEEKNTFLRLAKQHPKVAAWILRRRRKESATVQ